MIKDRVKEILKKNEKLDKWLVENGYYEAPAAMKHHGAYAGGLYAHSLAVAAELQNLTDKLGLEWERDESPILIGLLHDVCKIDDYYLVPFGDNGEAPGIEYNKNGLYPGHGEKSLIMLMSIVDLTEEEKMCIRYHMGAFVDKTEWAFYSRAVKRYPNVLYTHTADMIASQIQSI